jgi:MacB-like periplasmic core domain/FtsX-like permease family
MGITLTWLRLDARRRWRSLIVLALLTAVATTTVLTAVAGARRGDTAFDRLWARTLPATVTVLPNQPGFDWTKVQSLPGVTALGLLAVYYGAAIDGLPDASIGFPPANAAMGQTLERPVVLQGRLYNPASIGEVNVTPHFAARYGKGVGDTLTLQLSSAAQADAGFQASAGEPPRGPRIQVRIVGVVHDGFYMETPGDNGGVLLSNALFTRYRANIMGNAGGTFVNALIRLRGGEAAIPAFRADLARLTGRSDIDVWDNYATFGGPVHAVTGYEATWLAAFGLAALLAACILVGQSVARHVSGTAVDLQVLRAVGMTRWEMVASAAVAPVLATAAGATAGVAGAIVASPWMPIGVASLVEPHPGIDADWLVLGAGWAAALLLAAAGTAAAAWAAISPRRALPRGSAIATGAALAGLPVPVMMGTRFALEAGRGRTAVPVRPALAGVVVGVLGVVAAFTFYAGVRDAAANPARFGQTWQLEAFLGENGQDFGPVAAALRAVAARPDVTGVIDTRVGGAQASGQVSVESFSYDAMPGKQVPVVLTGGRMPATANEIVLAPTTAKHLRAGIGSVVHLTGGTVRLGMTVTGVGFVPAGPHNSYDEGAWLTSAGFARLFHGAHYAFKYHLAAVSLRPGADVMAEAGLLNTAAAAVKGGEGVMFTPPSPVAQVQVVKDVAVLPLALSGFLALLAAGAVGHALALAVRRRRRELAVLRALGLTRRQVRMVVVTQGSVLAGIGLVAGVPLGFVLGRDLWQVVAEFTPLAYRPPLALLALLLIGPVTVLAANLLALWPGQRAAALRPAQVLHAE